MRWPREIRPSQAVLQRFNAGTHSANHHAWLVAGSANRTLLEAPSAAAASRGRWCPLNVDYQFSVAFDLPGGAMQIEISVGDWDGELRIDGRTRFAGGPWWAVHWSRGDVWLDDRMVGTDFRFFPRLADLASRARRGEVSP